METGSSPQAYPNFFTSARGCGLLQRWGIYLSIFSLYIWTRCSSRLIWKKENVCHQCQCSSTIDSSFIGKLSSLVISLAREYSDKTNLNGVQPGYDLELIFPWFYPSLSVLLLLPGECLDPRHWRGCTRVPPILLRQRCRYQRTREWALLCCMWAAAQILLKNGRVACFTWLIMELLSVSQWQVQPRRSSRRKRICTTCT